MENSEWKEVRLGEVIQFNPRETIKKGEISKKIAMDKLKEFSREIRGYEKVPFTSGTKFRNGDTLVARITPCLQNGKTAQVNILNEDEVAFGSTEYIVMRKKENITDKDFIYYLSVSNNFRNIAIKSMTGTSGRQRAQRDVIENSIISLPPLHEQKKIASILKSLDDKIELNNQMNQTLEEMAQAIFKEWFVEFNFPNEDGVPYKDNGGEMEESELGMIPKGWRVEELGDLVKTFNGYSYKGKELGESNDAMLTIKNFDRNGGFKINGYKEINISGKVKPHHYVKVGDIVVAHTDLTQGAEIIGNPVQIQTKGKYNNIIISMDTVKVETTSEFLPQNVLYHLLKNRMFKGHALGYMNGTTVLHLNKKAIPEYRFILSNDIDLISKLNAILDQFIKKQNLILIENETLIKTRDTLLPKLMSGEVRV